MTKNIGANENDRDDLTKAVAHIAHHAHDVIDPDDLVGVAAVLDQDDDLADTDGDEFLARDYPPMAMIVGDVIPAGLILMAGSPKVGKSLLMMDLAVSAATGEKAWGEFAIERGDVLYLALEGGEVSFHSRLRAMVPTAASIRRLRLTFTAGRVGGRLEQQISRWLAKADDPRLVVVDTLAAVSEGVTGKQGEDRQLLDGLAHLANRYPNLLIVVVHHTRKAMAEDFQDIIAGSNGLMSATDGNAVFTRHTASNRAVFQLRPRNGAEVELVLQRDPKTLRWTFVGDDERSQLSTQRQTILDLLTLHDTIDIVTVAKTLGCTNDNARKHLSEMAKAGQIVRISRGTYGLASPTTDEEVDDLAA